ncbi:mitochondrial antiviral-signaling protein [Trichomycterus rosablanca]|uniref:mitochondrial antiviral-signaling protein n=1 Tax=Trichomycterus rosablanca TaxID=2290929 RepID=UPI002F353EF7
MAYVNNKLYEDKIKKIMGRLCTDVKVREVMPHLDCLTRTDVEEVEAKRDQYGNYNAVSLLLENLRRRENWPDQFINALRGCGYPTLADEIEEYYNRIRGINTQRNNAEAASPSATAPAATEVSSAPCPSPSPASAPASLAQATVPAAASATVTTATVHNDPQFTPSLLIPLPNKALVPSFAPPHIKSSLPNLADQVEAPALVSAPKTPISSPSEPAQTAELPPSVLASHVRPPSPVSAPQVTCRHEQIGVSISSVATSSLGSLDSRTAHSVPSLVAAPSISNNPLTVSSSQFNNSFTPSQLPVTQEESKVPEAIPESFSSVKHPIQDTCPPEKETVLTQDLQNSLNRTQPEESVHNSVLPNSEGYQAQVTSPGTAAAAVPLPHNAADADVYFSKPGMLCEEEPTFEVPFTSEDLEISHATTGTGGSSSEHRARATPVPNPQRAMELAGPCCSVSSDELLFSHFTRHSSDSHSENAVQNSFSPNEPEENHYESVSQSMQIASDVLEHNVEFSEMPSVQNLSSNNESVSRHHNSETGNRIQSSVSEGQVNYVPASGQTGSAADLSVYAVPANVNRQESELNASGKNVSPQSEQREEPQGMLSQLQSNSRLIAAAVGVTAIFIAWKLK